MPTPKGSESVPVGHLRVHLDDRRPGEVHFNFERQGKRMQGALGASFVTHIAFAVLIVLAIRFSPVADGSKIFTPGLVERSDYLAGDAGARRWRRRWWQQIARTATQSRDAR